MVVRSRRYAAYVLALLAAINFFNYIDRLIIVTMYDDLRAAFGFSDGQLGAFWLAFFIVHAAATMPLGWASDHFDRRKIMGAGVIAWSLATLGSAYAWGFVSMLLLRGAIGVGEAAYGPPSNALLCELYPDGKARAVAIFNAGMFAGACLGLAVGGLIGFPRAFQIVAIPGLLLGVLALRLKVPPHRAEVARVRAPMHAMLRDGLKTLRIPTLRWMLPAGILISFAAGGYITWTLDFTIRYKGLDKPTASIIYGLMTLTGGLVGVIAGGIVADRLHRRHVAGRALTMAIGFLSAVPFALLVIIFDHGLPYFVSGWLLLFFLPWYNGPMAAVIDDVVDDRDAATAQATFTVFLHVLGTGPSGFVLGLVSQYTGSLRIAFLVPLGCVLAAGVCALVASRHVAEDVRQRQIRAAREQQALA